MIQLTQEEFDELSDGPHDARTIGFPTSGQKVFCWQGEKWVTSCQSGGEWWFDSEGIKNVECSLLPVWHKIQIPDYYTGSE